VFLSGASPVFTGPRSADGTVVRFTRRKAGSRWIWTFSEQYINTVAKEFGLEIQEEDIVQVENFTDEYVSVALTQTGGLDGVFVDPKNAYKVIKKDLDQDNNGQYAVRYVEGHEVKFILVKRKRWYVWAFRKADIRYVAELYGLSINENLPRISRLFQLAVTDYGLRGYIESVQKRLFSAKSRFRVPKTDLSGRCRLPILRLYWSITA